MKLFFIIPWLSIIVLALGCGDPSSSTPKDNQSPKKLDIPAPQQNPPGQDPRAEDPPRQDPPAEDPPRQDPPAEDPPRQDPPADPNRDASGNPILPPIDPATIPDQKKDPSGFETFVNKKIDDYMPKLVDMAKKHIPAPAIEIFKRTPDFLISSTYVVKLVPKAKVVLDLVESVLPDTDKTMREKIVTEALKKLKKQL